MKQTRRDFLEALGLTAAASALAGCKCPLCCCGTKGKIAVQLYSLHRYIGGTKDKDGKIVVPGMGLDRTFEQLARIGYKGVEFAGFYGHDAKAVKKMLDDNGLVACGAHIGGWRAIDGDGLKKLAEFNLAIGNDVLICPGGTGPDGMDWGNPVWDAKCDAHMKFITAFYNERAETAKKLGCRVGIHNHQWEFKLKDKNGVTFWDHFFSGTSQDVLMEQDVGWTTCAGCDPCAEFKKYPGRSPTLHAKENGMGPGVKKFDAILGQPGCDASGKVCATPVDWDAVLATAESNGTEWWVVECEQHFDSLAAVTPSYAFLKSKGLN